MASFRIKFPEKEEATTIVLTGARITVGRLPDNTIQIVDRVISSNHAELVLEDGHYRLRDLGSTNGTFVNDQFVTDYHLREKCKVSFGTVDCEFNPETPAAGEELGVEALPTRAEVTALRQENEKLQTQVAALREELDALRKMRPMTAEEAAIAVPKAEYERVTADREALKEAQQRHHQEIARLKENLALLRRDRENLQRAWEITKAELNAYRPLGAAAESAAAPTPATHAETPSAPAAPAAEQAPTAPSQPAVPAQPAQKPAILKAVPVAKPPMAKPPGFSPAPAATPAATPTARPVPTARPAAAAAAPTVKAVPSVKATPAPGSGLRPIARAPVAVPPGGSGTQKLDPGETAADKPAPKILPKPVVKLGAGANPPVPKEAPRVPPPAGQGEA